MGEDFSFQINEDGSFTGLTFYVQLKSTPALAKHVLSRSPDWVTYQFKTKDLLRWESSATPVILVLWDVTQHAGVWQDVPTAVKALDARGKSWRRRKTVNVRLPASNTCDAQGRERLRLAVAHIVFPIISKGKQIRLDQVFSFPPTREGWRALKALERAINEGTRATIDKKYIQSFRASGWWEKAYGRQVPESITIGPSKGTALSFLIRLQVVLPDRTEALTVELHRTRAGRKKITFDTKENSGPVKMQLVVGESDGKRRNLHTNISFDQPCNTVYESLTLTKFLIATKQGGAVQLIFPTGKPLDAPQFAFRIDRDLEELVQWERVLQKLTYIQSRVARFGTLSLRQFSEDDFAKIERLNEILQAGILHAHISLTGKLALDPATREEPVTYETAALEEDLLGVRIPLGRVRFEFLNPTELREQFANAQARDAEGLVALRDVPVTLRYLDWAPPGNGPATSPAAPVTLTTLE